MDAPGLHDYGANVIAEITRLAPEPTIAPKLPDTSTRRLLDGGAP
jgi:hypothetical protein